jgi:FixJ family two-component response regulator
MPCSSYVVAVIDDDDFIRDALDALLPAFDCKVELYASADAYRAAAATTRANCLMIDVHLGTQSGLDLGRRLAQAGMSWPIIYMSATCGDSMRQRAHDAGGVAFLRKPFQPEELRRALDAARRRGSRGASDRGE